MGHPRKKLRKAKAANSRPGIAPVLPNDVYARELRIAYAAWLPALQIWLNSLVEYGVKLKITGDPVGDNSDDVGVGARAVKSTMYHVTLLDPDARRVLTVKQLSAPIGLVGTKMPTEISEHKAFATRIVEVALGRLEELKRFEARIFNFFQTGDEEPLV